MFNHDIYVEPLADTTSGVFYPAWLVKKLDNKTTPSMTMESASFDFSFEYIKNPLCKTQIKTTVKVTVPFLQHDAKGVLYKGSALTRVAGPTECEKPSKDQLNKFVSNMKVRFRLTPIPIMY